ncbi:MAG TPA: endonuclease/exonuclease/phosphatase family protein [Rhizomicrobium sp.]|nr:endonuclease/exonuclease/phosphatase family protein [Rhizomicrobium sp.]
MAPIFSSQSGDSRLRVVSWNLLRRVGAGAEDVAKLVKSHHPDLLLLQECTEDITTLPSLVGGHFFRHPMQARIYGLAAWSPHPFPQSTALKLPYSILPGRVPQRLAQIISFHGITIVNVHLSHGQFLNRFQLRHIMEQLVGPAAIIGDFNAVGPVGFQGFSDIGPRARTHRAGNILALRLDRCIARGLICDASEVLDKGPSDHHPMVLDMKVDPVFHTATLEDSNLLALS